jgi:hypothetical protein
MEQETDPGHLLTQHPIILFAVIGLLLLLILFGLAKIFGLFDTQSVQDNSDGDES